MAHSAQSFAWLSQAANAIMRPRLLVQSLELLEMAEWLMG